GQAAPGQAASGAVGTGREASGSATAGWLVCSVPCTVLRLFRTPPCTVIVGAPMLALLRHSALPFVPFTATALLALTLAPLLSCRWQLALSSLSTMRLPARDGLVSSSSSINTSCDAEV